MENHQHSKKELLEKLTEIYDQLEGLEKSLDENLSAQRKNIINEYSERLDHYKNKIVQLEEGMSVGKSLLKNSKQTVSSSRKKLKLELGF